MLNKCYLPERNHWSNLRFFLDYDFPSHICCEFFKAVVFFFSNSYFFRAKLLPGSHFLRIRSSLEQF